MKRNLAIRESVSDSSSDELGGRWVSVPGYARPIFEPDPELIEARRKEREREEKALFEFEEALRRLKAARDRGRKLGRPSEVIVKGVLNSVARNRNLSPDGIISRRRHKPYVYARAELYARLRALGYSLPGIGMAVGRDHTTILSSLRLHARLTAGESAFAEGAM